MRDFEEFATVGDLSKEMKKLYVSGDIPFIVRAKLRPVLAVSEPSTELREITALSLVNISRRVRDRLLTADDERAIKAGEHNYLLPLDAAVVQTLTSSRETYAVAANSVVRLHQSAISTARIGEVTVEAFAVIRARVAEALGLVDPAPAGPPTEDQQPNDAP